MTEKSSTPNKLQKSLDSILFIDPPTYLNDPFVSGWKFHQGGSLSIASCLKNSGYKVNYFDSNAEEADFNTIKKVLLAYRPSIVMVSAFTCQIYHAMYTLSLARQLIPETICILGGSHASFLAELTLKTLSEIDYIVSGEGEITILELINHLYSNPKDGSNRCIDDISQIKGIYYQRSGKIYFTGNRKLIEDLDQIPLPDYSILPITRYCFPPFEKDLSDPKSVGLVTSRGCTTGCDFCSSNCLWDSTWRGHSAARVVEEIQLLFEKFGRINFLVYDENLFINPRRNLQILEKLEKLKLPIRFWAQIKASNVLENRELIGRFKQVGWEIALVGLEYSQEERLIACGKHISSEDQRKAIEILNHHKIFTQGMMILGHWLDDNQNLNESCDFFSRKVKADWMTAQILTPFPGTKLFEKCLKTGIISEFDFSRWDLFHPVMKTSALTEKEVMNWFDRANGSMAKRLFRLKKYLFDNSARWVLKVFADTAKLRTVNYLKQQIIIDDFTKFKTAIVKKQVKLMLEMEEFEPLISKLESYAGIS